MKTKYAPYLFILPFFVLYAVFNVIPLFSTLFISFTKWNGSAPIEWVGFRNYVRLFTGDTLFWKSIWNTVVIIVIAIPFQVGLGLIMAVLLKGFFSGRVLKVYQFLNFSPFITTGVAVALLFAILFDTRIGTVNTILAALGLISSKIPWLTTPVPAVAVLVIMLVWKYFGYLMVMIMAGLSTIPETEYEAARIDGASWLQSFRYITLPGLKGTLAFILTTSAISGMQLFGEPSLLFSKVDAPLGGPKRVALTSMMYVYDTAFSRFDLGYGSAMSYGVFVIIFALSFFAVRRNVGGRAE